MKRQQKLAAMATSMTDQKNNLGRSSTAIVLTTTTTATATTTTTV